MLAEWRFLCFIFYFKERKMFSVGLLRWKLRLVVMMSLFLALRNISKRGSDHFSCCVAVLKVKKIIKSLFKWKFNSKVAFFS